MNSAGTITISILCHGVQTGDLQSALENQLSNLPDAPQFRIESRRPRFRTIDPTVLVAIVGVAGTALGALISELLKIAQQKNSQVIAIQSKDGAKLEVPADTPFERIDELVKKLRMMDAPKIVF